MAVKKDKLERDRSKTPISYQIILVCMCYLIGQEEDMLLLNIGKEHNFCFATILLTWRNHILHTAKINFYQVNKTFA